MEAPDAPLIETNDFGLLGVLFVLSLILHAGVALIGTSSAGISLSSLGVFYDGHLYIEIAKSFPLPYSRAGVDYLSHAPGYPALIAAMRAVVPSGLANWGLLAVWAVWIPTALCACAFYVLCRHVGVAPLWPTALFVVANPRWLLIGASLWFGLFTSGSAGLARRAAAALTGGL